MTRLLAIDWDRREARCLLASLSGKKLQLLWAGTAPLVDVAEAGGDSYPDIGGSLRAALDEQAIRGVRTLVAIDRSSVDLMTFALPPAKDAELPEMVAHQALRESPLAGDDAAVDFTPVTDDPTEPRQVIAAVLGPQQLRRIKEICTAVGVRPRRIVLRALAAASLYTHLASEGQDALVVVNVLADEADLTVVADGRPVFLRTVRLPAGLDEEGTAARLAGEIHRTLLVAQQAPLAGRSADRLVLFGGREEHPLLAARLEEELGLPLTVLDPFKATGLSGSLMPEQPGRFAGLLGALCDEAAGRAPAMDFLHTKRPPKPVDRRRPILAAIALVLVVLAAIGYNTYTQIAEQDEANQELASELSELNALLKKAAGQRQLIGAVRLWKAGEVNWLDELRDLSLRLPPSRDLLVSRISMTPGRAGGGQLHLSGLVRDPLVVTEIERRLREAQHRDVRSQRIAPREGEDYRRTFEISATVIPRTKDEYRAALEALAGR